MWYIGCYYAIGILAVTVMVVSHLIKAEHTGYAALEYWDKVRPELEKQVTISKFLIGWTLWPVRLLQGRVLLKEMYDVYDYLKYRPTKKKEL